MARSPHAQMGNARAFTSMDALADNTARNTPRKTRVSEERPTEARDMRLATHAPARSRSRRLRGSGGCTLDQQRDDARSFLGWVPGGKPATGAGANGWVPSRMQSLHF